MVPYMRKVHIFCCDPDATDSSDDGDDQNLKEEKKLIGEVLIPGKKDPSSRYRGVRRRGCRWEAAIRNPFTKKREFNRHDTAEEAAAAYQARAKQFHTEMLAMNAQSPVSELAAFSSSSSMSCVSSSVSCEQKAQEVQSGLGLFMEIPQKTMDESLQNFSPTPKEISVNALQGQMDELPVSDFAIPADEVPPLDDFTTSEDVFPDSDFIGAAHEPPDDDYIGLADISHLPLPIKDPGFDLDAALDWDGFDFASVKHELKSL